MTHQSQTEAILAHLQGGLTLTPLDALKYFGCFRLGARIYDIKKSNPQLDIVSEMVTLENGKRIARYRLKA